MPTGNETVYLKDGTYVGVVGLVRRAATAEKSNLSLWQNEMGGKHIIGKRQAAQILGTVSSKMYTGRTA